MDDLSAQIGEAAGLVWRALEGSTSWVTVSQLRNRTAISADMIQRALGWLARESKVQFQVSGKIVKVMLR
jgi:hypothetical protein